MSYNNELYIFSEVPGYDSSKGEPGIVKAFRNLKEKVECLEQVRMSEKSTLHLSTQANSVPPDLTVTDVQSHLLSTQLRYMIKVLREFANNEAFLDVNKEVSENVNVSPSYEDPQLMQDSARNLQTTDNNPLQANQNALLPSIPSKNTLMEGTSKSELKNPMNLNEKSSSRPQKASSNQHYHLKLDDVPFILGASSSASHSVVANVQNIIAMMKSHNKVLCAPKVEARCKSASSSQARAYSSQECSTDANEMFREISEGLSTLTQKQKKLAEMFDKPPTHKYETDKHSTLLTRGGCNENILKNKDNFSSNEKCIPFVLNEENMHCKNKSKVNEVTHKPSAPSMKLQTNNNPQLARQKMLRSLKDFKRHLSKEDISWE